SLLFAVLGDHMKRDPGQVRALLEADFARSGQKGKLEFEAPRLEVVSSPGVANKRQLQHGRNSA
ncbi:MAG TPA: B12-binding domain-containing radical SAM protein, partial [Gammaproteobacteria bacterium]|nr:B12-binding domain-containing radical SAM protein [Gammaproteobacteria bacterium]